MTSNQRVFILDTDVGADDAVALILCLKHHKRLGIAIEGITVCFGNVPVGNGKKLIDLYFEMGKF